jgi:hypothetical protein
MRSLRGAVALGVLALAGMDLRAQTVRVDTIREAQPWGQHEVYSFPRVSTPEDLGIAARINKDICTEFLEVDPDTVSEGIFSKVWGDAQGMPSVNALTWACTQPLPAVISIDLIGEFCGAYCEDFIIHYSYDLRTGERLRYDSLFTATGLVEVTDSLARRWRSIVQAQISKLSHELVALDSASSEAETLRSTIALYTACLEERVTPYLGDLIIRPDVMIFIMSQCSYHAVRALDELGAVELELRYAWLAAHFRRPVAPLFVR